MHSARESEFRTIAKNGKRDGQIYGDLFANRRVYDSQNQKKKKSHRLSAFDGLLLDKQCKECTGLMILYQTKRRKQKVSSMKEFVEGMHRGRGEFNRKNFEGR